MKLVEFYTFSVEKLTWTGFLETIEGAFKEYRLRVRNQPKSCNDLILADFQDRTVQYFYWNTESPYRFGISNRNYENSHLRMTPERIVFDARFVRLIRFGNKLPFDLMCQLIIYRGFMDSAHWICKNNDLFAFKVLSNFTNTLELWQFLDREVTPERGFTFAEFEEFLTLLDLALIKLSVHPQREEFFEAWTSTFSLLLAQRQYTAFIAEWGGKI